MWLSITLISLHIPVHILTGKLMLQHLWRGRGIPLIEFCALPPLREGPG